VILALPDLPDPIAVHWGADGTPDGFGSPAGFPVLMAAVALLWAAFAWAISRTMGPSGKPTVNQRLILAVGWFLSIVLTVTLAGSVLIQRGLEDATDAPSIVPLLLAGFGGGILMSVVAWFVLPASAPAPEPDPASLPVLDLADTQRGTWMQHAAPRRAMAGFLIVVMTVAVTAGGFALWFAAPLWAAAVYVVLTVALTIVSVASLYWRVRIDARGFMASSVIGFPRFTIPLEQVASAAQIDVRAGRDFGGWGVRWGGRRRFGVITRSGEALEVRRKDGRAVVVTVSQAESGAALLNSLAGRLQ
jgi:hypothetical protein